MPTRRKADYRPAMLELAQQVARNLDELEERLAADLEARWRSSSSRTHRPLRLRLVPGGLRDGQNASPRDRNHLRLVSD